MSDFATTRRTDPYERHPMRWRQRTLACVAIAAALVLTGCTAHRTPQAPLTVRSPLGAPYRIKVGDTLDIRFYSAPELNLEVPVRSDGKISFQLLGDIQAAGLKPDFGGQVYVGGEVQSPSALPFATGMTALQAINSAGGSLNSAKLNSVILIRRMRGRYQSHRLALRDALAGKDLSANVMLEPSDILHVPKNAIANVNVFVENYIRRNLPINPSMSSFAAF
jgi:protein involved in polysaccharide export with SLBB domain